MLDIRDPRTYIERFLKIRTKDSKIVPFKLNQPQKRLYDEVMRQRRAGKPVRIIILKARQMGFSTLTEGMLFHSTATGFNVESLVVAHKDDATAQLFGMSKRFYDELPAELKPMRRASNAQEIVFDAPANKPDVKGLKSRIRCATAGGTGIGRSYTLTNLHLSEFGFWPGDKMATYIGLAQAVPYKPGTTVIIESTANGYDEFKTLWDNAVAAQRAGDEDGFVPIFFPWFEMDEYRAPVPYNFALTDEERELKERFRLDDEQIAWRRRMLQNELGGDINLFRQEYPSTPDEAFIATGQSVFDKEKLVARRHEVEKDVWERGRFDISFTGDSISGYLWQRDEKGPIRIRRHPEDNVPYVIGGDTAGTGSDDFVGQVLDNRTGEQIAVLQQKFGEREYALQMYALGRYYNDALIGIETNYSTYPEKKLEEFNYPNLYVRQRPDTYTGKLIEAYGFETNSKTRPLIIDGLKDIAAHTSEMLTDFETLGQMLTFVYDDNWKPQAQLGEHDDLVMALAIAHYIRPQQSYKAKLPEKERVEWRRDQWEDYRRASPAERKILREKWGDPK